MAEWIGHPLMLSSLKPIKLISLLLERYIPNNYYIEKKSLMAMYDSFFILT